MQKFNYYKIKREDFYIVIQYNPKDESVIQVMENSVILSKGQLIGWENSSKEEFDLIFNKFINKLQTNLT